MSQRFFVETPVSGPVVELVGSEARHASRVMRLGAGDSLVLFDGSGAEFTGQIEAVSRDTVTVRVAQRHGIDRESACRVVLGVALPKGERQRWLVEKAVELGVSQLVPLETQRAVVQRTGESDRLRRSVIEASKQCGRNQLMQITTPQPLAAYLAAPLDIGDTPRLIADPTGDAWSTVYRDGWTSVRTAVGPEGGFTPEELQQARAAGWHVVTLGPRTLRVETAALALVARLVR
jgi:16S rRNA (uracil1498-N3)-methyltransferase